MSANEKRGLVKICNRPGLTASGFSLIEVLIALGILSVGFMSVTAGIIAASNVNRTTAITDQAIFRGQDITESLAAIPLDAPVLEGRSVHTLFRKNQKVEITVFDVVDQDNDDRDDFKTIRLKVWEKKGSA